MSDIAAAQWEIESLKRERQQLIREREEARAEAFSLAANQCLHGLHGDAHGNPYCPGIAEAEARGYRRGVQDAARAMENFQPDWGENKHFMRQSILALLEQTEPGEMK